MKQIANQSESSKAIKRINERIAQLSKILPKADSSIITPYSRALRESGVEFTRDKNSNRYRIKNTAQSRAAIEKVEDLLKKYKATTAGEYQKQVKAELTAEAVGKFNEQKRPKKETAKQREKRLKKYIKQYASKENVQKRIEQKTLDTNIQNMLDVIYAATGSHEAGDKLSALTKGVKLPDRDSAEIYAEFDGIRDKFREVQKGALKEEERRRARDLNEIQEDYAFDPEDYDD